MKVGDLVKPIDAPINRGFGVVQTTLVEPTWAGIIIGWEGCDPIVFWNEKFPEEREYRDQLAVIDFTS